MLWLRPISNIAIMAMMGVTLTFEGAAAQQAIARNGSCPSGYNTNGHYCVATNSHLHAIERNGSCPSGYNTSGNYCVRKGEGKQAIHRNGSCPSGYNTSGNYCVQNR